MSRVFRMVSLLLWDIFRILYSAFSSSLFGKSFSSYPSSPYSVFSLFLAKMMPIGLTFVIVPARTSFYIRNSVETIIHRVVHFGVIKFLFYSFFLFLCPSHSLHLSEHHIAVASIVSLFMLLHFNSFAIPNKSILEKTAWLIECNQQKWRETHQPASKLRFQIDLNFKWLQFDRTREMWDFFESTFYWNRRLESNLIRVKWIKSTTIIEKLKIIAEKYDNIGVAHCHRGHNSFNSSTQITNYTARNCSFMQFKRVVSDNKNQNLHQRFTTRLENKKKERNTAEYFLMWIIEGFSTNEWQELQRILGNLARQNDLNRFR